MSRHLMFFLIVIGCRGISNPAPQKIFIGCLVPSYGMDIYGYEAALNLAMEMINNRSDILPGYEIVLRFGDTFAYPSFTVRRVFEFVQRPKNESIRLLIGPAWSRNTIAAYQAASSFEIVQLSYAASSVELQDNRLYLFLFTNVPFTSAFNEARLSLIQHFGWKRIAILREYDDNLYNQAVSNLRDQIIHAELNVSIVAIEGFSKSTEGHPRVQLENLKKLDARIIVGEFSTFGAALVFCEAYRIGMFGSKYVWFLSAGLTTSWVFTPLDFHKHFKKARCNVTEATAAAEGFIVIEKVQIRQDNNRSISGLTAEHFMQEMHKRHRNPSLFTSYAFDSVWAAALMLNSTISEDLKYRPENAKFGSVDVRIKYASLLSQTQFNGMTGPHYFNNRERQGSVSIKQMRVVNNKATLVQVGTHSAMSGGKVQLFLFPGQKDKLWKDGKVPADETKKEKKILTYSRLQLLIVWIFVVFGFVYSLAFLYFNISKRNHKVVRMSSPMINNVVLLGCFLCYIFVFLLGIDSRFVDDHVFGILCNVRLYVLAIAFSLSFGALFSKTWRVHKIFTAQRAIKKKLMRDIYLMLFVLLLVVIDVIFITIWVRYDPLEMKEIVFEDSREDSRDLILTPILKICECTHRTKLLGIMYGYKGILLLFGVFLAWETRNVTIPALNDSKHIGMSVYNVVILSAIGATVSMVLKKTIYFDLLHVLVSAIVILSTTVTLTMVFGTKVHEYLKAGEEPEPRTRTMNTLNVSVRSTTTTDCSDVYEAYVKPKDVKHKWIQTEDLDSARKCSLLVDSPIHRRSCKNDSGVGDNGEPRLFEVNNQSDDAGQFLDSPRGLCTLGVNVGLCEDNAGSSMAMVNRGCDESFGNTEEVFDMDILEEAFG